jgi:N-acetylglucosamine kinase-like BadF-type ATPase
MNYKIGVDGGGTKTECILIDGTGAILERHLAPACNPSVVGPDQARLVVTRSLHALRAQAAIRDPQSAIAITHIYAAGSRAFWREAVGALMEFGQVFTADDSHPVLELATHGQPGLVLHGGTGSFVAARDRDGSIHYAGGLGWRFGDGGSGYDLGRRAIARGLLELQGWAPASPLGPLLQHLPLLGGAADAATVTRFFYSHADPNPQIAALAPAVLRLASEGDPTARQIVLESCDELLALATRVASKLFSKPELTSLPAGLSGPILTHPLVAAALTSRSPLSLAPVAGTPIEGVRRLLARAAS